MIVPKFIGLVTCSGEEFAGGAISRVAMRTVLQDYLKGATAAICLPLFLSGDKEEREFVKNFPCISIDGCDKACAKRGITQINGKPPTETIVLSEVFNEQELEEIEKGSPADIDWIDHPYTKKLAEYIANKAIKYLK